MRDRHGHRGLVGTLASDGRNAVRHEAERYAIGASEEAVAGSSRWAVTHSSQKQAAARRRLIRNAKQTARFRRDDPDRALTTANQETRT
jgi:hypothetical protein